MTSDFWCCCRQLDSRRNIPPILNTSSGHSVGSGIKSQGHGGRNTFESTDEEFIKQWWSNVTQESHKLKDEGMTFLSERSGDSHALVRLLLRLSSYFIFIHTLGQEVQFRVSPLSNEVLQMILSDLLDLKYQQVKQGKCKTTRMGFYFIPFCMC